MTATAYAQLSTCGISPAEAIRMGYGRLLGALHRFANSDASPEQRAAALGEALDFIGALVEATQNAPEEGEAAEFSVTLRSLYAFWGSSLAKMSVKVEPELLAKITTQVRDLAVAWDTMLRAQDEQPGTS